jgi:hypothetical protein
MLGLALLRLALSQNMQDGLNHIGLLVVWEISDYPLPPPPAKKSIISMGALRRQLSRYHEEFGG